MGGREWGSGREGVRGREGGSEREGVGGREETRGSMCRQHVLLTLSQTVGRSGLKQFRKLLKI